MRLTLNLRDARVDPRLIRLLLVALAFALAALLYLRVYDPYRQRTLEMVRQRDQLRAQVEDLRYQAAGAAGALAELDAVRRDLDALAATFPKRLDQPRLLEFWEKAAAASRLRLTGLTYGETPEAAGDYSRYRVTLTAVGPYAGHTDFALALEGMPWLFRLDGVTLKPFEEPAAPSPGADSAPAAPAGADPPAPPPPPRPSGPFPAKLDGTYEISLFIDAPAPQEAGAQPAQGGAQPAPGGAQPAQGAGGQPAR